jgi:hypothetical protein
MRSDIDTDVQRRAEALAVMHLTRRDDLRISRARWNEPAWDLLVWVTSAATADCRFGVQVRGVEEPVSSARELGGEHRAGRGIVADPDVPVCLILFSMDDDRGFYRWASEPVVSGKDAPALREPRQARWFDLDAAGLERIVGAVTAWYDAKPKQQAA